MKHFERRITIALLLLLWIIILLMELVLKAPLLWCSIAFVIAIPLAWLLGTIFLYRQIDLDKEKRILHLQRLDFILLFTMLYTLVLLISDASISQYLTYAARIRIYVCSYMIMILPISYILATLIVAKINRNKRDMLS